MDNRSFSAVIRPLCVLLAFVGMAASAQVTGTAPQYNWQDKEFAPDEMNGAVHLRVGFSGIAPGISLGKKVGLARGNGSCDMVYLYFGRFAR